MGWNIVADFEVKFDGFDDLIKRIDEVGKMQEVKAIVKESTTIVSRKSQQLVPVGWGERYPAKTKKPKGYVGGNLKRSHVLKISDYSGEILYKSDYAGYPEFGTRYQTARNYLGDPFRNEKPNFINKLKRLAK